MSLGGCGAPPYFASAQQELTCSGGTFPCFPPFVEICPAFVPVALRRKHAGFATDCQTIDILGLLTERY
jgi:hypothetical protein